jgi:hypothetical protein
MLGNGACEQNMELRGPDPFIERTFPYRGLCPKVGQGSVQPLMTVEEFVAVWREMLGETRCV